MSAHGLPFVKGHGTENDFVLIPDPTGSLSLSAADVMAICDRRAGLGGDGILRVVEVAHEPEAAAFVGRARWFMDYRNSDGSYAEMCGNGIRVFARYLVAVGLEPAGEFPVATRAGLRTVQCPASGPVSVDMGPPELPELPPVTVRVGERSWRATAVRMPNPHAVVFVDDLAEVGDLAGAPAVHPAEVFPQGVNVEFVVRRGPGHLALRVHERGSGETRSCGTGVCAAVAAAARLGLVPTGRCLVDVPGGRLEVSESGHGRLWLTGPAILVATGRWGWNNRSDTDASTCDAKAQPEVVGTGGA